MHRKSAVVDPVNNTDSDGNVMREWQIVQHAQALDEEALSTLFMTYYPKVYNYGLVRLGSIHAAEDLASEVMLRVLESIHRYHFKGVPFSAWVYRIAHNRLIDLYRRHKLRQEVTLTEWTSRQMSYTIFGDEDLDRRQLQLALGCLTEKQRQVIVLKFIEGFDNASVRKILGLSESAVRSLQRRAVKSLRNVLAGQT